MPRRLSPARRVFFTDEAKVCRCAAAVAARSPKYNPFAVCRATIPLKHRPECKAYFEAFPDKNAAALKRWEAEQKRSRARLRKSRDAKTRSRKTKSRARPRNTRARHKKP